MSIGTQLWQFPLTQVGQNTSPATDPIKNLIETIIHDPFIASCITIFTLLITIATAIATLTGNLGKTCDFVRKYLAPANTKSLQTQQQRLRLQLIPILQRHTAQRLRLSLHEQIKIDLARQEQPQRVGQPHLPLIAEDAPPPSPPFVQLINRVLQPFSRPQPPEPIDASQPTLALFHRSDIQGRLLILGEPGAGKTTELLSLAQALLAQAKDSDQHPIPALFELSAWTADQPIAPWLAAQLQDNYRIPPAVTHHWLQTQQLLPLLDGLDELGLENQNRCIAALNQFLTEHPAMKAVVCCRREQYSTTNLC